VTIALATFVAARSEILVKRETGLLGQGRRDGFGAEVPPGPPHPCEPAMRRRP
jgi:hypothetical protein